MDATRSRIPSRSDIRLADNILCAARRAAATLAALTLFTMAGLPISVAATRPISVTTDAAVAVDPIVPIADNVDYVLKPAPSSLTSEQVLYKAALVATVPTSESRFLGRSPRLGPTARGVGAPPVLGHLSPGRRWSRLRVAFISTHRRRGPPPDSRRLPPSIWPAPPSYCTTQARFTRCGSGVVSATPPIPPIVSTRWRQRGRRWFLFSWAGS